MIGALDLFAGPGGWSLACRWLDIPELGIELDDAACATREAAGFATLQRDLHDNAIPYADLGPVQLIPGLIASPPCQTFSKAGSGAGRHQLDVVLDAISRLGTGMWPAEQIEASSDERTVLVLRPLVWSLWMRPEWIVLEQVPTVRPVWEAMAPVLRGHGYSVATGLLNAEQYGVPQTRRRAVLIASRVRVVRLPEPTHSRYHQRDPERLDSDVAPWVSMADALGWGGDYLCPTNLRPHAALRRPDQPAPTMAFGHERPRWVSQAELVAYRQRVAAEVAPRVNNQSGDAFNLDWPCDRPAPTVAGRDLVGMPGANANRENGRTKSRNDGVHISVAEAGVLQTFPADFPWQGGKGKQYEQVGNAIPPLLALAVLRAATGLEA